MAIRQLYGSRAGTSINVNMTSMVDVVFLLIIFFVLVSQFISAENIEVQLPNPDDSLAKDVELMDRVVVNCQYFAATSQRPAGMTYRLGPIEIDSMQELQERLAAIKESRAKSNKKVQVLLRADQRITYKRVRDAMQAISRAGIENMHIAAEVED